MNQALRILDIFMKIQENSDLLQHKQEGLLAELSFAEVHCIDWIGMIDHPNVTKISEKMGLTRGGISRISKRLLGKGLIESYQEPDNNKEIYFQLTERGKTVYDQHKKIHNKARQEWLAFLEHYSDDEQATLLRFFTEISALFDSELADQIEEN
ncbi:MarR family transcriptional regulator [Desulfosporosinus hippei]|uniref:DNA-binding transcriptional regulator, MarR family n=1 Tax=Desulfosporosinus hippei DSM 8344 TaxID=1121419 RepID=A0A1G8E3M6_9FIRM|nr:MarR family transcriptional regulator [Desulfosporosinus hippei]SDH64441.1 DNA-binding transcriptional regulator, MarR family [Desulfosporosinus hippei DSM 8344]